MDKKSKIEDLYDSDKKGQGERVVIGLSSGIDSFVTAYLLKIQKYELFGVTVVTGQDSFGTEQGKLLSCHLDEAKLSRVKEFCQQLKIPHYVVKVKNEFQEEVVEAWMAAKATGTFSNACWNCHELRMRTLHEKALELDAKYFATGHYAKIFHHDAHGTCYVHTSNDELHDQASYLSRLPREILSMLKLPLSDLTKKEVLRLAENFGLEAEGKSLAMHECFENTETSLSYLQKALPARFLQEGEMLSEDGDHSYGTHDGVIFQTYGKRAEISGTREELYLAEYSLRDKALLVAKPDYFLKTKVLLVDCQVSEETSFLEPLKGAVRLSEKDFPECWIYPNSLGGATVEWEEPSLVWEGEVLSVYKKRGKNAKVFLTGEVRFLVEDAPSEREGEDDVEVDIGRDF